MPRLNTSSAHLLKAAVDAGITSPDELASLMGNAEIETNGFRTMRENLIYRDVDRVIYASASAATRYSREQIADAVNSRDPKQIATILYEGRNENDLGNSEVGDGYRFHGRGHFQITGRYNYKKFGEKIGVDLLSDPELAVDAEVSAKLAVAFWKEMVPQKFREDAIAAGARINGGRHAAERRGDAATHWASLVTPELIHDLQNGMLSVDELAARGDEPMAAHIPPERDGIKQLQDSLNRLGYVDAAGCELAVDGDYGRRTRLAVEDFQRSHGLVADGIAGPLTIAAVQRAVETELRSIGQPDAPYLRQEQPTESLSAYRSLAPDSVASPVMPIVRPEVSSRADDASYGEAQAHQGEADRRLATAPDQVATPIVAAWSERTSYERQDPRHPQSPNHDLYGELKRRIPDASEDRLLQFTAACHENRITANNMVEARLDEARGTLTFIGSGPLTTPAQIDLKNAPPRPEEAIEHIQQHDLQQARVMEEVRVQQAQVGLGHSR